MPCKVIGNAFFCSRGSWERCETCGVSATVLCDFPVVRKGVPATCDKKCCRKHAVRIDGGKDYCLPHHRYSEKFTEEGAGAGGASAPSGIIG